MRKKALLSRDKKYRYSLTRIWDDSQKKILFIMLNPSSADSQNDDPTIRRLISFTKKWGFGGFWVCNLYPYRTSSIKELYKSLSSMQNKNKIQIKNHILKTNLIVYAWGNTEKEPNWLKKNVKKPFCIDKNINGSPKHPLYISSNKKLIYYRN
tara:strand:+ start:3537 stop:3995 length:459 start_codon:yes stop_codon:yes gene_type:complete